MCNAYSLTHPRSDIVQLGIDLARLLELELDASDLPDDLRPRYRISPRQFAPILRWEGEGKLRWSMGLWGFLTKGGKPGFAPTNARDDKLASGWPWKMVSRHQRCLVPCDGFFEPEKKAGEKGTVPWSYYAMGNRQLFLMAGLWNEAEHPKTGEPVESFTVVTTSANAAIRVHDRMPLIVGDEDLEAWLRPGDVPSELLKPYPSERMTGWRVIDEARNSRVTDHAGMVEPSANRDGGLFDTLGSICIKVRHVPQDFAHCSDASGFSGVSAVPNLMVFYAADFRGRIPTESRSFSSEKSYSPSMLICAQAMGE